MKYKVGDKVTVRNDLKINQYYGAQCFINSMMYLRGKQVTIKRIFPSYYLVENNFYNWTDEMFKDIPKKETKSEKDKKPLSKRTIEHIITGKKTIVIIHNEDGTYTKGDARCHDLDQFDENEGFRIAYNRAMMNKKTKGIDIKIVTKLASEMAKKYAEQYNIETPQYEIFDVDSHWEDFLNNKLVINCTTEEKANEFLKVLYLTGLKWNGNTKLTEVNCWSIDKENTCYSCRNNKIMHGNIKYFKAENYKIVQW